LFDSISNTKNIETSYILVDENNEYKLKKDGAEVFYFDIGQKKSETYYKLDKKNGIFKEWYEDGALKTESAFLDDEKNGKSTYFFENGKVEIITNYIIQSRQPKIGVKDGEEISYYKNGNTKSTGKYKNNQKYDIWKYFKEDGTIDYEEEYEQPGVLLSKEKKAKIESEKAIDLYQKNVELINGKVNQINTLFEVSETEITNPLTGDKSSIQKIGKKKNIYKAYDIVSKYFVSKITNDDNFINKAKLSTDYNTFIDKIFLLANTDDTKNIEKELKNIENPDEIITIINK